MPSIAPCRTLLYRAVPEGSSLQRKRTLIYFITGNPGLVDYYEDFLSQLCSVLACSTNGAVAQQEISIVGHSLAGFEVAGSEVDDASHKDQFKPPFGLKEQIQLVERRLILTVTDPKIFELDARQNSKPNVILVGHSVGAYILLELIRSLHSQAEREVGFNIVGGICLFPTVTHIAKSPSGRKLSVLCSIPAFPQVVSIIARCLTFLLPTVLLSRLVSLVTGFPLDAAVTTTRFLQSRHGVLQALYMGRDEMRTITIDQWGEEVWGAATSSTTPKQHVKLFFYFGTDDHWVENETRDELILARAFSGDTNTWKPKMEIDKSGNPHGFCINHSTFIAEKVASYVNEILAQVEPSDE